MIEKGVQDKGQLRAGRIHACRGQFAGQENKLFGADPVAVNLHLHHFAEQVFARIAAPLCKQDSQIIMYPAVCVFAFGYVNA